MKIRLANQDIAIERGKLIVPSNLQLVGDDFIRISKNLAITELYIKNNAYNSEWLDLIIRTVLNNQSIKLIDVSNDDERSKGWIFNNEQTRNLKNAILEHPKVEIKIDGMPKELRNIIESAPKAFAITALGLAVIICIAAPIVGILCSSSAIGLATVATGLVVCAVGGCKYFWNRICDIEITTNLRAA